MSQCRLHLACAQLKFSRERPTVQCSSCVHPTDKASGWDLRRSDVAVGGTRLPPAGTSGGQKELLGERGRGRPQRPPGGHPGQCQSLPCVDAPGVVQLSGLPLPAGSLALRCRPHTALPRRGYLRVNGTSSQCQCTLYFLVGHRRGKTKCFL